MGGKLAVGMLCHRIENLHFGPRRQVALVAAKDKPLPKTNEAERVARSFAIIIESFRLVRWIVAFAGVALIVYVAVPLPLKYSAGKETAISLVYKVVLDARLEVILPYAIAAAFATLWGRERRLRKTSVRREHERVEKLERNKDPNRTSSGLEE